MAMSDKNGSKFEETQHEFAKSVGFSYSAAGGSPAVQALVWLLSDFVEMSPDVVGAEEYEQVREASARVNEIVSRNICDDDLFRDTLQGLLSPDTSDEEIAESVEHISYALGIASIIKMEMNRIYDRIAKLVSIVVTVAANLNDSEVSYIPQTDPLDVEREGMLPVRDIRTMKVKHKESDLPRPIAFTHAMILAFNSVAVAHLALEAAASVSERVREACNSEARSFYDDIATGCESEGEAMSKRMSGLALQWVLQINECCVLDNIAGEALKRAKEIAMEISGNVDKKGGE